MSTIDIFTRNLGIDNRKYLDNVEDYTKSILNNEFDESSERYKYYLQELSSLVKLLNTYNIMSLSEVNIESIHILSNNDIFTLSLINYNIFIQMYNNNYLPYEYLSHYNNVKLNIHDLKSFLFTLIQRISKKSDIKYTDVLLRGIFNITFIKNDTFSDVQYVNVTDIINPIFTNRLQIFELKRNNFSLILIHLKMRLLLKNEELNTKEFNWLINDLLLQYSPNVYKHIIYGDMNLFYINRPDIFNNLDEKSCSVSRGMQIYYSKTLNNVNARIILSSNVNVEHHNYIAISFDTKQKTLSKTKPVVDKQKVQITNTYQYLNIEDSESEAESILINNEMLSPIKKKKQNKVNKLKKVEKQNDKFACEMGISINMDKKRAELLFNTIICMNFTNKNLYKKLRQARGNTTDFPIKRVYSFFELFNQIENINKIDIKNKQLCYLRVLENLTLLYFRYFFLFDVIDGDDFMFKTTEFIYSITMIGHTFTIENIILNLIIITRNYDNKVISLLIELLKTIFIVMSNKSFNNANIKTKCIEYIINIDKPYETIAPYRQFIAVHHHIMYSLYENIYELTYYSHTNSIITEYKKNEFNLKLLNVALACNNTHLFPKKQKCECTNINCLYYHYYEVYKKMANLIDLNTEIKCIKLSVNMFRCRKVNCFYLNKNLDNTFSLHHVFLPNANILPGFPCCEFYIKNNKIYEDVSIYTLSVNNIVKSNLEHELCIRIGLVKFHIKITTKVPKMMELLDKLFRRFGYNKNIDNKLINQIIRTINIIMDTSIDYRINSCDKHKHLRDNLQKEDIIEFIKKVFDLIILHFTKLLDRDLKSFIFTTDYNPSVDYVNDMLHKILKN